MVRGLLVSWQEGTRNENWDPLHVFKMRDAKSRQIIQWLLVVLGYAHPLRIRIILHMQ